MSRFADETEGDIEQLLTSSESSSLRDQMQQFIEANGGEIDLKVERKIKSALTTTAYLISLSTTETNGCNTRQRVE